MVSLTAASAAINQTRFEELWLESESAIRRYIWTLRPAPGSFEDILQETAIALWRKFDVYDPTRPFAAWGCRFALLQVLKHRQRSGRDRLVFGMEESETAAKLVQSEVGSDLYRARRDALTDSLNRLDETDRLLLSCRYGSGETVQSMAQRCETSVHKLYHALDSLREKLKIATDQRMIADGWERSELA